MPSLNDLVAPIDGATFIQQYWNRTYVLLPGNAERFHNLLSWEQLNSLIEYSALRPPRLRLVLESRTIAENQYMDTGDLHPHVNVAGMTEALSKGATLVLDRVDRLLPQLRSLAVELENTLRCRVDMNVYGSWRTQKGFHLHWDTQDVLIVQVSGRKHWKVYEPTRLHPLRKDSQQATPPVGEPIWEGVLEEGSTLYLPRGWWHVVQAMDEPSLHITVGLTTYTGADLLTSLLEKLRDEVEVRQDLPLLTAEERVAYQQRLRDLLAQATSGDFLRAFEQERDAERVSDGLSPRLPNSVHRQLKPIAPDSRLRLTRPVPLPFQPGTAHGLWRLNAGGKEWPCNDAVKTGLSQLSYARSISLTELNGNAGNPQSQLEMRILLTVLTTNGIIFIE